MDETKSTTTPYNYDVKDFKRPSKWQLAHDAPETAICKNCGRPKNNGHGKMGYACTMGKPGIFEAVTTKDRGVA